MNALLLALHLTVTTNHVAQVRFVAPEAGNYSVQSSGDGGLRWLVIESVPAKAGDHVVAHEACDGTCKIYRVEWRPGKQ